MMWYLWTKLPANVDWKERLVVVGSYLWLICFSATLLVMPMAVVLLLVEKNPSLGQPKAVYYPLAVMVVIWLNVQLVHAGRYSPSRYLSAAAVGLFFIFFPGWISHKDFIPNRVMDIYKFGHLSNASMILDEVGCAIVQQYELQKRSTSPDQKTCALTNATIISRLGNAYYVNVVRDDSSSVSFTIPTQNVLSWAVNDPKKSTTVKIPQSTQNPAFTTETSQSHDNNQTQ